MKAYGAEIVFVEGTEDEVATLARETRAAELAETIPRSIFLEQAHNPANAATYERTMAHEILGATDAHLDLLVGAAGTGGSLSGCARGLKSRIPRLCVVGVEPAGSIIFGGPPAPYYPSGTGTPGGVEVGRNVDYSVIDEGRTVGDQAAFNTARFLARNNGLLIGGAAGGVVHAALTVMAERREGGVAVAILADGGEKYLDTVFDDASMDRHGLLDPALDRALRAWVHPSHAAR
jgi:cystathionine beta-synthase